MTMSTLSVRKLFFKVMIKDLNNQNIWVTVMLMKITQIEKTRKAMSTQTRDHPTMVGKVIRKTIWLLDNQEILKGILITMMRICQLMRKLLPRDTIRKAS